MAQFLIKFQEINIHTVLIEGVDSLEEAKELITAGPHFPEGAEQDSWFGKVSSIQSEETTRLITGTDTVNLQ